MMYALVTAALGATVAPRESALTETTLAAGPTLCGATCPWDTAALPITCTDPKLNASFPRIVHYSGVVDCGNLFLDVDLGSAKTYQADLAPWIHYAKADPSKLYTIIMCAARVGSTTAPALPSASNSPPQCDAWMPDSVWPLRTLALRPTLAPTAPLPAACVTGLTRTRT